MIKNIFKTLLAAGALLSGVAAFAGEEKVAEGFLTLRLSSDGTIKMDLPKDMLGREMVLFTSVEKTSDGGEGIAGFTSKGMIQFCFDATDSLVLVKEYAQNRNHSVEPGMKDAVAKSNIGAITATFARDFDTRDSSFIRFDATEFFRSYDSRISPVDQYAMNSFGGLVHTDLILKNNLSSILDVEGFAGNMSVLSLDTYDQQKTVLGMRSGSESEPLTVLMRRSILLLPEEPMRPRIADSRVGVLTSKNRLYGNDDRGSKERYYANRWRLDKDDAVVFYLDTLFTPRMAAAITQGVLEWNKAFEVMGWGSPVKVVPFPSNDPTFNINDLRYSCIVYEPLQNNDVRSNTWTDPRTGEILGARIYVPFDAITKIHARMIMNIGHADESIRTSRNTADILYEGLQADVANAVGTCLGLAPNYAGSYAIPVDSLKSARFTSLVGISGSIMDKLPYNFVANMDDAKAGTRLVQTCIGPYDVHAMNWLYSVAPGCDTPESEKAYLDSLIKDAETNPLCLYINRGPSRVDVRYMFDPRAKAYDLGNDHFKATEIRMKHLKETIPHLHEWLNATDPDYTFRPQLNEEFIYNIVYGYGHVADHVGGVYFNEPSVSNGKPGFTPISKEEQKRAFQFLLDATDDFSWIDNDALYRDMIFVRSMADYMGDNVLDDVLRGLARIQLIQELEADPLTLSEAYDMLIDHTLKGVKKGKPTAMSNKRLQYVMINYTFQQSNALAEKIAEPREDKMLRGETSGYDLVSGISFGEKRVQDHIIYEKLAKIRKIYARAARRESDEKLKAQYEYLVMAIDRVLEA